MLLRTLAPTLKAMDGWDRVIAAVIDRRSELGWTQKRLAAEAGVAERTVQNFEAGRRPQPLSRGKIEKALGWPSGEMRRIASEEPADILPEGLREAVQAQVDAGRLTPEEGKDVIAAVEATLRGEPVPVRRRAATR